MNLIKLSLKNVKKSFRDYVVYFLTLILGVSIFYTFNTVGEQSIFKNLSESGHDLVQLMLAILKAISIAVSFVLGFLILYANNFLIRRRKKEFGVYLILGMSKWDVSRLLISETLIIGLCSLAAGLFVGVFLSQFLSILAGYFFEADMSAYAFTVSFRAIRKTILNFSVMYLIVLFFHTFSISKLRLISLFRAEKKTERQYQKNPVVSAILFLLSAAGLFTAYYKVAFCAEQIGKKEMLSCILLGIVGTFLLFWSVSGFLFPLLRRKKKLYHSGLNSFLIRKFSAHVNSSAFLTALLCLMLFATICSFSAGFSLVHGLQENIKSLTPVDFTIEKGTAEQGFIRELLYRAEQTEGAFVGDCIEIPMYENPEQTLEKSLSAELSEAKSRLPLVDYKSRESFIGVTDYNRLMEFYGKEPITLSENSYAVVGNFLTFLSLRNVGLKEGRKITLGAHELSPAFSECVEGYFTMAGGNVEIGKIIVPDEVLTASDAECRICGSLFAGNYSNRKEGKSNDAVLFRLSKDNQDLVVSTKLEIRETNNLTSLMAAFVVLYLGIVFLLCGATLLSLKILTEAIDSAGDYEILKKIGASAKERKRMLFLQTGISFFLPLLVAVLHSVFGLRFLRYVMTSFAGSKLLMGVVLTGVFIVVIYGSYLLTSYFGCKRILSLSEE